MIRERRHIGGELVNEVVVEEGDGAINEMKEQVGGSF